jgi:hypothetical protein
LLAKQITSLTVDFSQSIDLYRYQYISYPELRLVKTVQRYLVLPLVWSNVRVHLWLGA